MGRDGERAGFLPPKSQSWGNEEGGTFLLKHLPGKKLHLLPPKGREAQKGDMRVEKLKIISRRK